jgi:arylsulfatase A-like enzyme
MVPIIRLLLAVLIAPLSAQTVLIGPTVRNGGFEDADGSSFATTPFWDSYYPEADAEDPVSAVNPRSGTLRGLASGYLGTTPNRIHLSQTIPATDWTIAEGDVFHFTVHARPGFNFDVGADSVQLILHVVDGSGNPVPTNVGNQDRILSEFPAPAAFTAGIYTEITYTTSPVPSGSPWIGHQLRPRILIIGDRNEYALIDAVELLALRGSDPEPPAEFVAHYPADGDTQSSVPGSSPATADPSLAFGPGFGTGASFETGSGGAILPFDLPLSFSIAFWMKTETLGEEASALRWNDGDALIDASVNNTTGFGISLRGPRIAAGINNRLLSSQTIVSDNAWHHVVVTRAPLGAMNLYIDGRLEDRIDTSPAPPSISDPTLGRSRLGGRAFAGLIDELRLFTGVLTPEEIEEIRILPGDSDGDGFSDAEEAAAGTNWGDASDFPRLNGITKAADGVRVGIEGRRSREYQLERRLDLVSGNPESVPDAVAPLEADTPVELVDSAPPADKAFYQVRASKGPQPRPNILLIVGDDHGYADISAFPNARPDISTPSFDRLATSGAILTQAYVTSPVCSPSRCGFLTGRMQNEWDPTGGWAPRLPAHIKHIAEYLKEAGYATAMIGKNDFGQPVGSNNNRDHPTNHGFDRFFGFNAHAHDFWLHSQTITDTVQPAWPTEASAHLGKFADSQSPSQFSTAPDGKWQTELFTDKAINYLTERSTQEQPFFLYLSHASVHALIHQAPKSYLDAEGVPELPLYNPATNTTNNPQRYTDYYYRYSRPFPQDANGIIADADMRKYYRAHLKAYDDEMGRLLDSLESLGLDENTIIIYFSDNGGEALTGANNQPLSGSKYNVFEGGLRVPMIISWPGRIPGGLTYNHVTSALDVVPTLLDVAGVEEAPNLRGHSLIKPLKNNAPVVPGERTLFWRFNDQWAIRRGDWKLVLGQKNLADKHTSQIVFNEAAVGKVSLFNLAVDPGEMNDLAADPDPAIQAIKADLQARYDAWNASN